MIMKNKIPKGYYDVVINSKLYNISDSKRQIEALEMNIYLLENDLIEIETDEDIDELIGDYDYLISVNLDIINMNTMEIRAFKSQNTPVENMLGNIDGAKNEVKLLKVQNKDLVDIEDEICLKMVNKYHLTAKQIRQLDKYMQSLGF